MTLLKENMSREKDNEPTMELLGILLFKIWIKKENSESLINGENRTILQKSISQRMSSFTR